MSHESKPTENDVVLNSEKYNSPGTAKIPHLEMKLPPVHGESQGESTYEMLERLEQWDADFVKSAQKALRDVYGYTSAVVTKFECLMGRPGFDESDYELTVSVGDKKVHKIGEPGAWTIKIIVRRVPDEVLH